MIVDAPLVPAAELAEFFGVDERTVRKFADDEGMPKAGRNQYDLHACARWYIAHLRVLVRSRSTPDDPRSPVSWSLERARATRAQADLREIDLAKARGELLPVDDAVRIWEESLSRIRARFMALIASSAVRAVGLRSVPEATALLEEIVHQALSEIVAVGEEIDAGSGEGNGSEPAATG